MGIQIKEIMEKDTYILRERDSVEKALFYLCNKEVSGVPIINDFNEVVGYISDGDILYYLSRKKPYIFDLQDVAASIVYNPGKLDRKLVEMMDMNIMEIASHKIVTVNENTDIEIVADVLSKKKYKKIAIVNNRDKIVGVATRWTIVNYVMKNVIKTYEFAKDEK